MAWPVLKTNDVTVENMRAKEMQEERLCRHLIVTTGQKQELLNIFYKHYFDRIPSTNFITNPVLCP